MGALKLLRYAIAGWMPGGRRQCVLCSHRVHRFMPYRGGWRSAPPLMRAVEITGSNWDAFECPRCGSHDRERHLWLYLRAEGLLSNLRGLAIVHFAPEARLAVKIRDSQPRSYVQCDLNPARPDMERVDLLDMPFADESVDVLIANHVLEHVADDLRALKEIGRVLVQGGVAILQTPYSRLLHRTWEDAGIVGDDVRLQAYGQEDHVRLYGRDIFERFAVRPLVPEIGRHDSLLPDVDSDRFGVNADEPLFLYRKRD